MINFIKATPSKAHMLWLKRVLFIVCLIPLARLVFLGLSDQLSANPIEFIERSTGFWSLLILLVSLALTPIRLLTGCAWPIQLRRMLGLYMFFYACLHVATYVWLDFAFNWADITKDISKHPRILIGFAAFILSVPLAITSNNFMMKRLRGRWKELHQWVYLISILAVVHFWCLVKKDIREPLLYACILAALLGERVYYQSLKKMRAANKI